MPTPQSVGFFSSPGFDYSADIADIERRRKLAEALQAESMSPIQQQTAGGYVVPISPLQGVGKIAQAWSSRANQEEADRRQRELSTKAQTDLTNVLNQAQQAYTGTPAIAAGADDMGGGPGRPAQAPDALKAASLYMSHPMTAALGTDLMGKEIARQRLISALRGQAAPDNAPGFSPSTSQAAFGTTEFASSPGVPRSAVGGPAGGIPMQVWLATDPSGASYMKQLASDFTEANKPVINRGFGIGRMVNGQYVPDPNSLGQIKAVEQGKMDITQPYEPPVTIKTSSGQEIQLSRPEYAEYQKTGVLPARYGQPAAPAQTVAPQPPARPGNPPPANFPRETPADRSAAATRSLGILEQEAAEQRRTKGSVDPELQREIDRAKGKSGIGTVGLSQPQEDVITQGRQQAAGKAVDEQFAKDYVSFTSGGGAQDAAKQIAQLRDVKTALDDPKADLTGFFRGKVPDAIQGVTSAGQKAIAMRERVEEVVQRSLRTILGAQFTEKEGERLIARAYNPNLSEAENSKRVGRLLTQLEKAYESKQDAAKFFEQNGTLQGWTGKLPSISDFNPDVPPASATNAVPSTARVRVVNW